MTHTLKPYPAYKPSDIEWLGDVPAHWEVRRAKYILREVDERSKTGAEGLLSVSHMTGVTPRSEKSVYMFMAEDYVDSSVGRATSLSTSCGHGWGR